MDKKKTFNEIKQLVENQLKVAYGKEVKNFIITYAKLVENEWQVNVEFKEKEEEIFSKSACFAMDASTGDLKAFYKDRVWRF